MYTMISGVNDVTVNVLTAQYMVSVPSTCITINISNIFYVRLIGNHSTLDGVYA